MNQHRTHQLKRLFLQLPGFDPRDPRSRAAWRSFKASYSKLPAPRRAPFMRELTKQVAELNAVTRAPEVVS